MYRTLLAIIEIKQTRLKETQISYYLVSDIFLDIYDYMVFDLCSCRDNSIDSAIESIV